MFFFYIRLVTSATYLGGRMTDLRCRLFLFNVFFDDVVDGDEDDEGEDDVAHFVGIVVDEVHVVAYDVAD